MVNRYKNLSHKIRNSKDGRTLVSNFSYLILLQVAGYLFPLFTLPYLAKIIGVEGFGKIAFASAIMVWFQTIADWGFNYTATRDVAKNRDNLDKVSEIFSNILWARCILTLVAFVLLLCTIFCIPKLRDSANIIFVTFLMIPGHIMFPDWFYQALERMKYITIFNFFMKILFTTAVFVFIKEKEDYIIQPLLTSTGYIICGVASMYLIIVKWKIRMRIPSWQQIFQTIKSSTDVFINNLFPTLYNAFSTVMLGFVGGSTANGMLEAGMKFEKIATQFMGVISRVFFPFLSRRIDKHRVFVMINLTLAIFIFLVLFLGAPLIIRCFFASEFYEAIPVLQIISFSIIFLTLSNTYGTNYLIITHHERELRNITIVCSLCGFLISFPLIYFFGYIGAAITITATRGMLGIGSMILYRHIDNTKQSC